MLYEDVLNLLPDYWSPMSLQNRFQLVELNPFSKEHTDVCALLNGEYYSLPESIFRIQNPLMYAKFVLKKKEYETRGSVDVKPLYHDTAVDRIRSICEFNFDWRMGKRFMFGPGVYFSIHPDIAYRHSSIYNGPYRAMFLVDVLVQKIQQVDDEVFLPDPGFDTVLAHGNQTYVKYFDSEFYPKYVMTYTAKHDFLSQNNFMN